MRDPFAGYDAWLEAPFQRMCAEQEAEWEAYETWCEENEREMLDNPAEDTDWQTYCKEANRLIDESWSKYAEEVNDDQ
jgi:hypothetical protein